MRKVNLVTTPKFPPPPRIAQKRSGCSVGPTRDNRPSAVTISASSRLSIVSPKSPAEVAHAAAEGQAPDPGVRHDARRGHEAMQRPSRVDVAQQGAPSDVDRPSPRIHLDGLHPGQVAHDAVVAGAKPSEAVTSASNGQWQAGLRGDAHDLLDVVRRLGQDDRARPAIDHAVIDATQPVVLPVPLIHDHALRARPSKRIRNCDASHADTSISAPDPIGAAIRGR